MEFGDPSSTGNKKKSVKATSNASLSYDKWRRKIFPEICKAIDDGHDGGLDDLEEVASGTLDASTFETSVELTTLVSLQVDLEAQLNGSSLTTGCIIESALNYDASAKVADEASCIILGCTNANATNFNSQATANDGNCAFDTLGCADATALNFERAATLDDGSCEPLRCGCTDPNATNFWSASRIARAQSFVDRLSPRGLLHVEFLPKPSLCRIVGCTDPRATNFNPAATIQSHSTSQLSQPRTRELFTFFLWEPLL